MTNIFEYSNIFDPNFYSDIRSYQNPYECHTLINIDEAHLENINIDKDILGNIDIDMGISENIDIDIDSDKGILRKKDSFFQQKVKLFHVL